MRKFILLLLVLSISCFFAACRVKSIVHHRAEAIKAAQVKLAEYVTQKGLKRDEFKGPYTFPEEIISDNSYEVCYFGRKNVFCYYQFTDDNYGFLKSEADPDQTATKRHRSLDPYGPNWFTEERP